MGTLNPLMIQLRICEELREFTGGGGYVTLNHTHALCYLLLGMTDQGIEMDKVIAKMNLPQRTTATRILNSWGDDPDAARGKCFYLFSIRTDPSDGRYKRVYWGPKGRELYKRLMEIGVGDDLIKMNVIENEIQLMSQSTVVHHHMNAETGTFKWTAFEREGWGKTEERPIPLSRWRQLDVSEQNELIHGNEWWWVDDKSGHVWRGKPNDPEKVSRRKLHAYTFDQAKQLEEAGDVVRKRADKGVWEIYDALIDNTWDAPIGYVKRAPTDVIMDMAYKAVRKLQLNEITLDQYLNDYDWWLNKDDFYKLRKQIWALLDAESKELQQIVSDTERRAAAEYRNAARADAEARIAYKVSEDVAERAREEQDPEKREDLEAEENMIVREGRKLAIDAKKSWTEWELAQDVIKRQAEMLAENQKAMAEMTKLMQRQFGEGSFGTGTFGGSAKGDDDDA